LQEVPGTLAAVSACRNSHIHNRYLFDEQAQDAASWLRFVIAHEYSHTHRAFGEHDPDAVRKDLVFEGLAMVFAETIVPKPEPYPWDEITAEQEEEFWAGVDPEASGLKAILQYMSHDAAYEVSARIIRAYLQRLSTSIAEAHRLPDDGLYWESGYPLLR
jgi:uncharacterized protein YjaZ